MDDRKRLNEFNKLIKEIEQEKENMKKDFMNHLVKFYIERLIDRSREIKENKIDEETLRETYAYYVNEIVEFVLEYDKVYSGR